MKNPYFYLTTFTVEGHSTWRVHVDINEKGFQNQIIKAQHAKVTEARQVRIDRATGEIVAGG